MLVYCCYQQLPIKLPQNLAELTSIYYFSVSVDQESRQFSCVLWVRVSHKAAVKVPARTAVTLRLNWVRICFHLYSSGYCLEMSAPCHACLFKGQII